MLATLSSQLASSDPITTHLPLIPLLLASLGTLSTALYFVKRHEIKKANKSLDCKKKEYLAAGVGKSPYHSQCWFEIESGIARSEQLSSRNSLPRTGFSCSSPVRGYKATTP